MTCEIYVDSKGIMIEIGWIFHKKIGILRVFSKNEQLSKLWVVQ